MTKFVHNNNPPQISDNQIRVVIYSFILLVFMTLWFYRPAVNMYNLHVAENCFARKDYICAYKSYSKAFATGMENDKYVKHYFTTLSKMKPNATVQNELNNLLVHYPDSEVSIDIEKLFDNMRTKIDKEYPITYISNVIYRDAIVHWNNVDSIIKVYIDKSAVKIPDFYEQEIKKAFNDYEVIDKNLFAFEYTSNHDDADIVIRFDANLSNGNCSGKDANCLRILALTENNIVGDKLEQSVINLKNTDLSNTEYTPNQIYNISKHEIGHALGVAGHSYYPEDVMYPIDNAAELDENQQALIISRKKFSQRDIYTMKLLYNIVPDITNKHYNLKKYSNMYFPIAVLGTKSEIAQKKLEESMQYINTVEESFISKMNLAEGYLVNKDFDRAKTAFYDAVHLAKSNEEKFSAYNNLAVVYYEMKDYQMAINYALDANTYQADGANEILAYSYLELKKYDKAEPILQKLIDTYPTNALYSSVLTGMYIKQYRLLKAFGEMHRIKQVNPGAFSEPCYKQLQLLGIFV